MLRNILEDFDQFAHDYRALLDESLKCSGEKGDYFAAYKAVYIARLVGGGFSGKILDYGCGIGLLSEFLVKYLPKARVDGYDVSSVSIGYIPTHLKRQGVFTCDIHSLEPGYDVVVAANVLHHVKPSCRHEVVASLKRLMTAEGKICIFEHNPRNPLTRKVVRESPVDKGVVLLPSSEVVFYIQQEGVLQKLDYIVFFPKFLSMLRWMEPFIGWCPWGAQYVAVAGV